MPETADYAGQIAELKARCATNPKSPSFARLAWCYLQGGKVEKAFEVCSKGVGDHPGYPTGRFVLGKCYEAMGRNVEAMLEYRQALHAVPDNQNIQTSLRRIEEIEEKAFRAFVEERSSKIKKQPAGISLDKYFTEHPAESESTIEFLLRRLKNVKRITPQPFDAKTVVVEQEDGANGTPKIVTATLAEIYAGQSRFSEAIDAYRKLQAQQPGESERYQRRIEELEELMRGKSPERDAEGNEKAS